MPKYPITLWDLTLHNLSMEVARLHREAYFTPGKEEQARDLLTAYRAIRRHINFGKDGKRHGATKAHEVMQSLSL